MNHEFYNNEEKYISFTQFGWKTNNYPFRNELSVMMHCVQYVYRNGEKSACLERKISKTYLMPELPILGKSH